MSLLAVREFCSDGWTKHSQAVELSKHYCRQLEIGHILFFAETPFPLNPEDRQFLSNVRQSSAGYHKNISYRPLEDRIRGVDRRSIDIEGLRNIMRTYSQNTSTFISNFLEPYKVGARLDFTSFRPIEEENRKMPLNSRNDLLHVDAFPTRPTNGDRILRIFTNVHPSHPRGWMTSDPFDVLARQMAVDAGLRDFARRSQGKLDRMRYTVGRTLARLHLPVKAPSPYDRFMVSFHNYLKQNAAFQQNCPKYHLNFPPGSTWIVFTDMVPHAVLFGQFALEQTFFVARQSLLQPELAPASILESLAGTSLTHARPQS